MCMWIGFEKGRMTVYLGLRVIEEIVNQGLSLEDSAYHGIKAELSYMERKIQWNLKSRVFLEKS